jgi:hypothetical protein
LLFDHLVGAGDERRRHVEAQRPGDLEVDHQFELRRLLDRQFSGFRASENTIDVGGGELVELIVVDAIRHQAAAGDEVTVRINSGQSVLPDQRYNPISVEISGRAREHDQAARARFAVEASSPVESDEPSAILRVGSLGATPERSAKLAPSTRGEIP